MAKEVNGPESMQEDMIERRCHHCNRSVLPTQYTLCSTCQMVYYCSHKCCQRDLRAHSLHCAKLLYYNQLTPCLISHPFTFIPEISSELFTDKSLVKFLRREGVYNLGMWSRETPVSTLDFGTDIPAYGELDAFVDPYVLPLEGLALECFNNTPPSEPLTSWEGYYQWRGFPLSSPIAILLQHVLTVYHILQISGIASNSSLCMVLAGVEKEADLITTFMELCALMPGKAISIIMVGPSISAQRSRHTITKSNLTVTMHSVTLQDYLCSISSSSHIDIIICLNAGLSAYASWKDAIVQVVQRRIKCYITDFCLLSLDLSQRALLGLAPQLDFLLDHMNMSDKRALTSSYNPSVRLSEPTINPFRDPKRKFCESARFPWFSNAFICELLYD